MRNKDPPNKLKSPLYLVVKLYQIMDLTDFNIPLLAITAIAAAASAFFAFKASRISSETAEAQTNAVLAQVILELRSEYSSPEMHNALIIINDWKREHGDNFAKKFGQLKRESDPTIDEVNQARRRCTHYFTKIRILFESGVMSEELVKQIVSESQFTFLTNVLELLEQEATVRPHYDIDTFSALRSIFYSQTKTQQRTGAGKLRK